MARVDQWQMALASGLKINHLHCIYPPQNCSERRTACWKPPLKSWTEFRSTKMEKGTSQFCWSAGRCGAMRRGVPAGMLPRPGHAAAKAAPMGRQPRPRHACVHAAMAKAKAMAAPMGRQPRPRHAAKALACLRGHAGMPLGPLQGHGSTWGGCCCQA